MKKLLTLIGAITLTTTVSAVTIVSCGMRTNAIEFTINGKEYDKNNDWRGQPQTLMMNTLELLTFDERKYTNENTANKVLETLGEKGKTSNLYSLSKDTGNPEYDELNKRLNSMNNDGIKSFDLNWGSKIADDEANVTKGQDLNFTVITQTYDSEDNGSKPEFVEAKNYKSIEEDENIWGASDDKTATELKEKFTSLYKDMEFSVIGGWTIPAPTTDVGVIQEEDVKDGKRVFNENVNFNFIEKDTKEDEPKNYVFDIAQAGITSVGDFEAKIGFGDLNGKQGKDIDIKLAIKNARLVMSPSVIAGKTETTGEGEDKKTTKTFVMTWLPSVYTFASSYKNLSDNKNIFENIDISLI